MKITTLAVVLVAGTADVSFMNGDGDSFISCLMFDDWIWISSEDGSGGVYSVQDLEVYRRSPSILKLACQMS